MFGLIYMDMMVISFVISLFVLIALFLTGCWLVSSFKTSDQFSPGINFVLSVYLGIITLPLIASVLSYWEVISITTFSLIALWFGLLIGLGAYNWRIHKSLHFRVYLPVKEQLIFFGSALALMAWLQFRFDQLIGSDALIYLYRSSHIIGHGFSINNFDRNIVHTFPVVLSLFSGIVPVNAVKLMSILFFGLSVLTIVTISKELFDSRIARVSGLLAITSYSLLRLSLDIFAMELGFIGIAVCLLVFLGVRQVTYHHSFLILIAFLWGSLFNIHGLVAASSIVFISLPLIYFLVINVKPLLSNKVRTTLTVVLCLVVFFVSSQPLINMFPPKLYIVVIQPIHSLISQQFSPKVSSTTNTLSESTTSAAVSKTVTRKETPVNNYKHTRPMYLSDFPAFGPTFVRYHTWLVIALSLAGLMILVYILRWSSQKDPKLIVFFFFATGMFGLTQQHFFGQSWFPLRFVMGMTFFIIPCAAFALERITNPLGKRQLIAIVIALSSIAYLNYANLKEIYLGYRENTLQDRYDFFVNLGEYIKPNSVIISHVKNPYIAPGTNPDLNVLVANWSLMCEGMKGVVSTFNLQDQATAALGVLYERSERFSILNDIAENKTLYVLYNTELDCIHPDVLNPDYFQVVAAHKEVLLLEYVRSHRP